MINNQILIKKNISDGLNYAFKVYVFGCLEIAEFLMKNTPIEINGKDEAGYTAFHDA